MRLAGKIEQNRLAIARDRKNNARLQVKCASKLLYKEMRCIFTVKQGE